MTLPFSFTYWVLSAVPIVLLLFLLMFAKMPAIKAAPITLLSTLLSSLIFFRGNFHLITIELGKAMWSSISIVSVVITAIMLYETSKEANAFGVLNEAFKKVAPNELVRIFLVGVVFAGFLQGVTGFGVPILVTAPLLLGIGVSPIYSVIIPMIGHCWGGTFGTLALAWHALILQTDLLPGQTIIAAALYASILLAILNLISGFFIAYMYGGFKGIAKGFPVVVAVSLTQGIGQILVTRINPDLGVFIPSALSALVLYLISRSPLYNKEWRIDDSKIMERKATVKQSNENSLKVIDAFVPYIAMTVLTLAILLIPAVNGLFGFLSYGPSFPETRSGYGIINKAVEIYSPIKPFTHAAFLLLLSALIGYYYYIVKKLIPKKRIGLIVTRTFRKAIPSSIAVISLISISRIMTGTGQTELLARGVSGMFGHYYSLVSPFIGLLGAFITSSNMSSNILFGGFQYASAQALGINSSLLLGAQTAGGSLGISIAPSSIVLGATTAGIVGREGEILKKNLPFALAVTLIFGIITFILV